MSSPWGPALDAELAYRHDRARKDFRPSSRRRQLLDSNSECPAQQVSVQHVPTQRIPAPVPLIPSPRRPEVMKEQSVHAA